MAWTSAEIGKAVFFPLLCVFVGTVGAVYLTDRVGQIRELSDSVVNLDKQIALFEQTQSGRFDDLDRRFDRIDEQLGEQLAVLEDMQGSLSFLQANMATQGGLFSTSRSEALAELMATGEPADYSGSFYQVGLVGAPTVRFPGGILVKPTGTAHMQLLYDYGFRLVPETDGIMEFTSGE